MTGSSTPDANADERLDAYEYSLPEDRIALRPASPRRSARLLVVKPDALEDHKMTDLPSILRAGDLLIFNDTKVIPARLFGVRRRESGDARIEARIEATVTTRLGPDLWEALARPAKRLRPGDVIRFSGAEAQANGDGFTLTAAVTARAEEGGRVTLRFDRAGADLDAAMARVGVAPLPPYISQRRAADAQDADDYQTMFADKPGAVAAPTASLHFDETLMAALSAAGLGWRFVTLHVGPGTFLPVTADDVSAHRMHAEIGALPEETARAIAETRAQGGRVIAIGTTALRVLETAAAAGGGVRPWSGSTDLFIRPGHAFLGADAMLTNFHLPKSTLMMLVAALMGRERILSAYEHALHQGYRFYSYGDASLLLPKSE